MIGLAICPTSALLDVASVSDHFVPFRLRLRLGQSLTARASSLADHTHGA